MLEYKITEDCRITWKPNCRNEKTLARDERNTKIDMQTSADENKSKEFG